MYLVYESLYGDLLNECDSTNIIGIYDSRKIAIDKLNELVNADLKNGYVLDDVKCDTFKRLFWNKLGNWNCYYEIFVMEMKLQTSIKMLNINENNGE